MRRIPKWWLAAGAGTALAAVLGVSAVMAQTPVPGTSSGGTSFLDRVAAKLGIDSGTLRDAVKSSAGDEIDARVQAGDLTQAQADALKQRIANAPDGALGFGGHGFGGPGFGHGRGFGGDELATFFGITEDQVRTELQADGATLASVAEAHGKSRDELKAYLTSQAKTHLDQEVTEGDMTQAQADAMLSQLTSNLDAQIDSNMPQFGHGLRGGRFGPGGDDGAPPAAAPTPASGQSQSGTSIS